MTQMRFLCWPKEISTTATVSNGGDSADTATPNTATNSLAKDGSTRSCCCLYLTKFVRKLKRQGKMLRSAAATRQSTFQCRYDPLSYSLNFDTSGCGSLLDDGDYYQFCAFSSRFVANPRRPLSSTPVAASH